MISLIYSLFIFLHPIHLSVTEITYSEKDKAFQVNTEAVGVLAAVCKEQHTKFIHISTDYVFDGTSSTPYKENDKVNPQGVYGVSKAQGEVEAVKYNPDSIIIRTAWVYSAFGKNFVKTMLKLMQEREDLKVVNDQTGSPTYAADLAEAILQIINAGKWQAGIYHYTNEGIITWYDFALAIKELSGSNCKVLPIPSNQYPTPAKRPVYSVLDKAKIVSTYQLQIKPWKDSLQECIKRLA